MALSFVSILFGAGPTPVAVVEPVRLEYAAHDGCPSASRLFEEVAGRTDRVRRATDAEPARAFRITVSRDTGGSHASFEAPVGAAVTWFFSRVEACPLRPTLRSDVIIELCAAFDAGAMRVAGKGLIDPDSKVYPWFAAGAGARLVWRSSERIELDFGPAFTVPLRRYPFQYDDPAVSSGPLEAYRIPPVALALTLGAGYRFP